MLNRLLLVLSFGLVLTQACLALDENNYQQEYSEKILPLLQQMDEGYFVGEKNIKIHYRTHLQQGATNCLVILPGRSEPVEKYAEVIHDLAQTDSGKKMNFFLMDHRGQGSSERMAALSDMGYVDQFQNYVRDLDTFLKFENLDKKCEKKFMLAHSMGAGIATAFLLEHQNYFDKVALSSPMLKIMTKPYAYGVARAIVEASTLAGRGAKFAVGQKGFNPAENFEENKFTSSLPRFKMTMAIYELYPKTKLGGVSNKWVLEVMKGTNKLRSRYHEISTPLRVYHAGLEAYSWPVEMIKFCDEAVNCKRTFFPNSKHEVLMDQDETRKVIIASLNEFFI
jgi:lysophospholipase